MPGPGLWPLAFVALVPWAIVNERAGSARRRFLYNYIWGAAFFAMIVFWLARITWFALAPVVIIAPLFVVFAGFVYIQLRKLLPPAAALPLAWLSSEVLRTIPPFFYPWDLLGYAAAGWLDFAGIASIGGVWILGVAFALVNGAIAGALLARTRRAIGIAAALVIATIGLSAITGAKLRAVPRDLPRGPLFACIQPNIEQELKENPGSAQIYMRKIVAGVAAAAEAHAEIVVLPETMLPSPVVRGLDPETPFGRDVRARHFIQFEKEDLAHIRKLIGPDAWLLTGALLHDTPPEAGESPQPKNVVLFYDSENRETARYDKLYLVPGGEMVPLLPEGTLARALRRALNPYTYGMVPDLIPGDRAGIFEFKNPRGGENSGAGASVKFGVSICYDNVFTRPFREPAAGGAAFHVVLSNEGWFPDSLETGEMGAMLGFSAIRAIETKRAVLRATNTGVSCLFSPDGSIEKALESGGRLTEIAGTFVARPAMENATTVYVTVGDVPAYFLAAAAAVFALVLTFYRRTSETTG